MMKIILYLLLFTAEICMGQITVIIKSVPKNTKDIFIAGDFNNWDPGNMNFKLENENNVYRITLPFSKNIEYKFTQGSWTKVEVNKDGSQKANRIFRPSKTIDTVYIAIERWKEVKVEVKVEVKKSTAQKNVVIVKDIYMPELNRYRTLRILLPLDYKKSKKRYPVVYMHDAQNLFDDAISSFGNEWGIDETLNKLQKMGGYGCIVVGIDNSATERMNEYNPFNTSGYGKGLGDRYADFIALHLKPYIDSVYRTLPMRDFTAIGGSSMGGSISQYIALKYPDKFSKVFNFSPAYHISDSNYIFPKTIAQEYPVKMYMVCGYIEGNDTMMQYDMRRMRDTLLIHGFSRNEIFDTVIKDGAHSEWFWNREFAGAYNRLFGEWKEIKRSNIRHEDYCCYDQYRRNYLFTVYSNDTGIDYSYYFLDIWGEIEDTIYKMRNKNIAKIGVELDNKIHFWFYVYDNKNVYYKFIAIKRIGSRRRDSPH